MDLYDFVRESNRIEGIMRKPSVAEVAAHMVFLDGPATVEALEKFVAAIQPDAVLRRMPGVNVVVGMHRAPEGGPHIVEELQRILDDGGRDNPYVQHQRYEHLHPFTDGNGRSGRVLWLKNVGGKAPLGFLHSWYYLSLQEWRKHGD